MRAYDKRTSREITVKELSPLTEKEVLHNKGWKGLEIITKGGRNYRIFKKRLDTLSEK